jgi:hypothetical protein
MNCAEANQIDMVDYLNSIGHSPQKMNRNDYWYLSPLRDEKHPSFKVNRIKNVWYDHGIGKGGSLLDFVMQMHQCDVAEVLQKLSFFHPQNIVKNNPERSRFHLHENSLLRHEDARQTGIRIIAAKQPIEDPLLCRYLRQRNISKSIADKWCYEVHFIAGEKEKIYRDVVLKNNAGGNELCNEYFKGSSALKYVSYIDNNANNISVFEGFFDFLSYQFIHQNQKDVLTNFLVLNSLSLFERSVLLMQKHEPINLYLDNHHAGRKWMRVCSKQVPEIYERE